MKKKISIFIILLILTGCTASANINIDYNGNIKEEIVINFENKKAVNYNTPTEYAKSFIDYYDNAIRYKKYSYQISENKNDTDVTFYKEENNICETIKYSLFSQYLYKNIECIEDEEYYTVESINDNLISKPLSEKKFDVTKVNLNITVPGGLVENNADNVSKSTYTWIFDQSTDISKKVYFKISKNRMKEEKQKEELKIHNKKVTNIGTKIFTIFIIILIISISGMILYKKYKNNRLEY